MASTRISTPMRGVSSQFARLSIRRETAAVAAPFARTISTSPSSLASLSPITTCIAPGSTIPLEDRTVNATIHHFPSLEPLRFEAYPANHLYLPTRRDILHRAVVYEGDGTRLGTASTKWRSEVHGSAKKVRPQKGSGRARLGDKKSPMLKGGGVAFGPKPRDFSSGLQKKVYDLAWRTALSYRFRKGELIIVDNALEIESPSTSLLKYMFKRHRWGHDAGRSILVTLQERPLLAKTLAEAPKEGWTATWENIDVKDILSTGRIIIERQALQNILLTHQEDIADTRYSPKLSKVLEPVDLHRVLGWKEFQKLEAAEPEELPRLQPILYERVAAKRLGQAELLSGSEAPTLKISAYALETDSLRLRIDDMQRDKDLKLETSEDEQERIKGLMKRMELLNLQLQRGEIMAASMRLQGEEQRAADWDADVEYFQDEMSDKTVELNELKGIQV